MKEVLLQTSEDFYVVPCGGYSEDKLYIRNRCYRILKVLQQKFSRTIIHYPCEEEHWRNLIHASKAPQLLFLLSEDQELYQVELRAAKEVTKLRWSR
ncbi:MAG: hypothetical protein VX278_08210 [Myxococcota bacterium]|nr:hypothetical protein [Myxococcota bacterium]